MQMSSLYVRCAPNAVDDGTDHHADRSSERFRPYVPFHVKATRPRCDDEGCPDRPGRASHKEGESWSIIAKRSWRWTRRNCAMQWRLLMQVEMVRFAILASSTILKPRHASSWQNSRVNTLD